MACKSSSRTPEQVEHKVRFAGLSPVRPPSYRQSRSYSLKRQVSKMSNIMMKERDSNGEIKVKPTDSYGEVGFSGGLGRSISKFVRLSDDSDIDFVYEDIMLKLWMMDEPRLLLSVAGGTKNFDLEGKMKKNFFRGLAKVCAIPGCWVITAGTNTGVMKHVGDALHGSKALIGITTWGIVTNSETLKRNEDEGLCEYKSTSWLQKGASLDNNHSHFLLVDDGSTGKFGKEIPFRAKLVRRIVEKGEEENINIPSALLVVQGGPGTLKTVEEFVQDKNPVILFKCEGYNTANALIYACKNSEEILIRQDEGYKHGGLVELTKNTFKEEDVQDMYKKIVKCMRYRKYFTFVELRSCIDVHDKIMEAVFSSKQENEDELQYNKLELSLMWNRVDFAKKKFLNTAWRDAMKKADGDEVTEGLDWITIMALAMNNVEFVEMLLGYGVNIANIVNCEVLEFLYGYLSYDNTSPLKYLLDKSEFEPVVPEDSNRTRIYKKLVSLISYCDDTYTINHITFSRKGIEGLISQYCEKLCKTRDDKFVKEIDNKDLEKNKDLETPFRELFFWALFNNMSDMALLFWRIGEEQLALSLVAEHVIKQLKEEISNRKSIVKALTGTAEKFQKESRLLLDTCYDEDYCSTMALLVSPLNRISKELTIIHLALKSENLDFISHDAVQKVMNVKWTAALKSSNISLIKILLSFLFPPLIFNIINFRSADEWEKIEQNVVGVRRHLIKSDNEDNKEDMDDEFSDTAIFANGGSSETLLLKDGRGKKKNYESLKNNEESLENNKKSLNYNEEENSHGKNEEQLDHLKKLQLFYTATPVVKFVSHTIAYLVFLSLLSYSSMTTEIGAPTSLDWYLFVTVFSHLVAEVYQIMKLDAPSMKDRVSEWWFNFWNIFDVVVISLYFASFGLRFHFHPYLGHVLYSVGSGGWWLRLLHMLVVDPTLGPYLIMISRMMKDLMKFTSILAIVVVAYGVTSASILTPRPSNGLEYSRLRDVIWKPYFNLYGELFADCQESNSTTSFGTDFRNSYDESFQWLLLGVYMLFTNILLLNLLIAIFNDRYAEVKKKAQEVWAQSQAWLILEYEGRHSLFAPFSLIGHLISFVHWIKRGLKPKTEKERKRRVELLIFESDCMKKIRKKDPVHMKIEKEILDEILKKVSKNETLLSSRAEDKSCTPHGKNEDNDK